VIAASHVLRTSGQLGDHSNRTIAPLKFWRVQIFRLPTAGIANVAGLVVGHQNPDHDCSDRRSKWTVNFVVARSPPSPAVRGECRCDCLGHE
jgi:hypothetical protein